MKVIVRLYPPFNTNFGQDEIVLTFPESERDDLNITLKDFLEKLKEEYSYFEEYISITNDTEQLYHNITIVRGGLLLRSQDRIYNKDLIKIFPFLSGG